MRRLPPVVILAGGRGTRLGPLTRDRPKALVSVAGKPFIHHQFDVLRSAGINEVIVCAGYLGHQFADALRGINNPLVDVVFDGPELLGTAGAIRKALPLLPETFFVLYGDSYLRCDYERIYHAFLRSDEPAMMVVCRPPHRKVNVQYAGGMVLQYDKWHPNDRMGHIDYGLAVWRRPPFLHVNDSDLADVYACLASIRFLAGYENPERYYTIGTPEALAETEALLRSANA